MQLLIELIYKGLLQTTWLEMVAVFSGIASVWYSRKENVLVYPVGLINTTIYIYLSFKGHLLGEASVNMYYTIMSVYGWYLWTRKEPGKNNIVLQITKSNKRDWMHQLLFFSAFYLVIYSSLLLLKKRFCTRSNSLGRRTSKRFGLYGHVVDGEKESGKLDMVDNYQYRVYTIVFYKRICFH